jgi:hypothetical protein
MLAGGHNVSFPAASSSAMMRVHQYASSGGRLPFSSLSRNAWQMASHSLDGCVSPSLLPSRRSLVIMIDPHKTWYLVRRRFKRTFFAR